MPVRDTVALLRELDPVEPRVPVARPRRRRLPRAVAAAAAATAAAVAGLALTGGQGRPAGLAATAYAALTAPDRVLHLQLRSRFLDPMDQPATTQLWTRAGTGELRVVYDGGAHEFARDSRREYAASYVRASNTLTVHTDPAMWRGTDEELDLAGPQGAARMAGALPALLARARDGDPAVRRLPDADLGGRPAARLQTVLTIPMADGAPPGGGPPALRPTAVRTVVWLDLETHLPRRIERFAGPRRQVTTEVAAEQLPITDATERLLDLAAPPDARRVVDGRP